MRGRSRTCLACAAALLMAASCGDDDEEAGGEAPAAQTQEPAAPAGDPPGEAPPEEEGLRDWVTGMYRRALVAAGTGDLTLDAESQANQRAQGGGVNPRNYTVSTTYFLEEGSEEGQFTVTAIFFRDRQALRYMALRPVSGNRSAHPAVDSDPVLARWDTIIRRRVQQESCAFPLLDPPHTPAGFTLSEFEQRDLDRFASYCETAQTAFAGNAQRSRSYTITWDSDSGGGGSLGFDIAEDGSPTWRSMHFTDF